jgi:asparagine synthase (glutamine-hydrolysing)
MCGIAGVLHHDGADAAADLVQRMTRVLSHRGPDGEGVYVAGPVGLGHRRLAIIDLSPAGKQPMANEDGSIWVTYNGEIYNFADVRRDLERRGHLFRSRADTEVIVHAYEEWGKACLEHFNGMFAFALWDGRKQCLWLVRDRLGIKPLFYRQAADRFLFGSEIKAILQAGDKACLDHEALAYYLALNYTPAPYTLFASIRQLLPGQHLTVAASGQVELVDYWDVTYCEDQHQPETVYLEQFNALLEDAVRLRLVSDVPFGAFLSGGVDSSAVTYWMSRLLTDPVKSFSIGFDDADFDELPYARQAAGRLQTEHYEEIVTADAAATLPRLVWHAEEPTADSSMLAVYHLAQMTGRHVTMALSGDGADELLAGYETYQAYYLHRLYHLLPRWLRRHAVGPLVRRLPVSDAKVSWDFKLRRFLAADGMSAEDAHATRRMIFDAAERQELLAPVAHCAGSHADVIDLYRDLFARTNARRPLNRMLYVDTRFYLPNDMLVKVDRMSMAHGLEVRVPFLDYRLVEFAARVPPGLKLKRFFHKKYLLKASLAGKVPEAILRRKKEGFNVPKARWLKQELRPFVCDHLARSRLQEMGFVDGQMVEKLLQEHFSGRLDNSHKIWCLLTLSLWWQQFMR